MYRWDVFQHGLRSGPDSPCFGHRVRNKDGTLGDYVFKTYKEIEAMVQQVGSGVLGLAKFDDSVVEAPGPVSAKLLGVYSPNTIEWLVTEQVCNAFGLTLVPLYDTLGEESTIHVLENSGLNAIVCDSSCLAKLVKVLPKCSKLTINLVVVSGVDTIPEFASTAGFPTIKFRTWDDILRYGSDHLLDFTPAKPDQINTISYTSGTSGIPKGVVITQSHMATLTVVVNKCFFNVPKIGVSVPTCYLSYLPLAHMYERLYISECIFVNARIGMFSGDIRKILDDLKCLKPTVFPSVPRLFIRIHDKVFSTLSQKAWLARTLFSKALNSKLKKLKRSGDVHHAIWDKIIFKKFKTLFGGEVAWMMTGSAPLPPAIYDRIRTIFSTPLLVGYALTETGAAGFHNFYDETDPSHVGGPIGTIEFKLRSLPEFEYYVTDKNPRGELMLRGTTLTPCYFRNEKANKEGFQDGWFLTGDIAELLPNGAIRIIDRRKNLFKLVQGEYISPEKLESVLVSCPLICQAFVTGRSHEVYPVAIVVPDEIELELWAKKNDATHLTTREICQLPKLKEDIFQQITAAFESSDLKGYEKCKQFYVEWEMFSIENDMLTTTNKLRRNVANKKYDEVVTQLYAADKK
ncbi:long-chain-fatty-acid CoA ligase, putative [Theileria equi strain WA]|uniref:Long-chain-fatty-acid CoA ligase, putative n=1 Tax=Theileria equi strain WA TaxID=1537102 RepID=L0B0S1_THEEQ|nr:long-chain-fatty-acid CoA ligase, putative [Theileria equi strain WA]AFZ80856.1 long-chain-fatty-acid CoA ligase, putative [Theileria equi strain WA]|eukprot:XP_004830522.1 long-chain-fatty-acid CoA ligase, putative [Theileria equi strain WA]